jgi:UDP-N-acetyl-D-mannosaminuronate dehydrogenase
VLAVAHEKFKDLELARLGKANGVTFDLKAFLDRSQVDGRL